MQKSELAFSMCRCAGEFKETFSKHFFTEKTNMNTLNDFFTTMMEICNYYSLTKLKSYLETVIF